MDRTGAGTQHKRAGKISDTNTVQLGPERFGQPQDGAAGETAGGATRPKSRERQHRCPLGDEAHTGDSHALHSRVHRVGDVHREQTSWGESQ